MSSSLSLLGLLSGVFKIFSMPEQLQLQFTATALRSPFIYFFFRHCKIKEIVVPLVYFTKTWSNYITRIFISVYIIAFSYSFTSVQLTCQAFADGLSHENHLLPINFFLSFSTLPFDLALLRTSEKIFFLSRYRTSKCLETNHNLVTSS